MAKETKPDRRFRQNKNQFIRFYNLPRHWGWAYYMDAMIAWGGWSAEH